MPDPITWYTLGRVTGDPERIMEAIDAKLLSHNEDPSAHGQTAEAVYAHRNDPTFDHPQYTIYNIKMAPSTRTVKAFCDAGGAAEFEKIQDAINYVNQTGGGTIHIKPGTYTQTKNITLYNNIDLIGEDRTDCIIDFDDKQNSINMVGLFANHKRDMHIKNLKVQNSNEGTTGAIYFSYADDCSVEDCEFSQNYYSEEAAGGDIYISNCKRIHVQRNVSNGSEYLVYGSNLDHLRVEANYIGTVRSSGVDLTLAINSIVSGNTIVSSGGDGITLSSGANEISVTNNHILDPAGYGIYAHQSEYGTIVGNNVSGSGNHGIYISASPYYTVVGNSVNGAVGDGIRLYSCDLTTVTGNVSMSNRDYGVNVFDEDCYGCVIVGNTLHDNSVGALNDDGYWTDVGHNTS